MIDRKLIKITFDNWEACGDFFTLHVTSWDGYTTDYYCLIAYPRSFPLDLFYEFLYNGYFFVCSHVKFVDLNSNRYLMYDFAPFRDGDSYSDYFDLLLKGR